MYSKTVHIDEISHEFIRKKAFDNKTTIQEETNKIIKNYIIFLNYKSE